MESMTACFEKGCKSQVLNKLKDRKNGRTQEEVLLGEKEKKI